VTVVVWMHIESWASMDFREEKVVLDDVVPLTSPPPIHT